MGLRLTHKCAPGFPRIPWIPWYPPATQMCGKLSATFAFVARHSMARTPRQLQLSRGALSSFVVCRFATLQRTTAPLFAIIKMTNFSSFVISMRKAGALELEAGSLGQAPPANTHNWLAI